MTTISIMHGGNQIIGDSATGSLIYMGQHIAISLKPESTYQGISHFNLPNGDRAALRVDGHPMKLWLMPGAIK